MHTVKARQLALLLRGQREQLISRWTQRVLEDPLIPETARSIEPELHDWMQELLDRLSRDLEGAKGSEGEGPATLGTSRPAREHERARTLADDRYGLTQTLRQLCHLRATILDLCAEQQVPIVAATARLLDAAIDESMIAEGDEMERVALDKGQRLAQLLEQSHEAVLLWKLGEGIVSWNRGAEELYGWSASEAIGRVPHVLLGTRQAGRGMGEVEQILALEGRWKGELEHVARDGRELLVESRLVVRSWHGQTLVLEMNRDITELRQAEKARRESEKERESLLKSERAARTEAEHAARLRDDFVATVSHELRTPLTAILGWTKMLLGGTLDAAATSKALDVIERNARAQAELVEDLLDLSRIGSGKFRLDMRRVNLAAVLRSVVASHLPAASAKGLHLYEMVDDMSCTVQGDPARLEQVASNLLSNAIKFTPQGGRVTVVVRRAGSHAELLISDTGKGVPADFIPHLFTRFRQAEASLTRHHRGLGLGLALVKFLVEQHGGEIHAESDGEGRGATFTVTLPIVGAGRVDAEPLPIDVSGSLAGVKAVVVEDDDDTRTLIARILEDCKIEVTVVASAAEALAQLRRVGSDVLISDIGMPEVDGYQLIRAVRALSPEQGGAIPAVALTAFARPEERCRALDAGYQRHVAKPIDQTDLLLAIAEVTRRVTKPPEQRAAQES